MIDIDLHRRLPTFALDVAFRNDAGITALFGRSGSGKSMTIGMIAGLARPDSGHVRIGGTVLVDTTAKTFVPLHKRRIGLVFQDAHLFPHLSVRKNLAFGQSFAPKAERTIGLDAVVETLGIAHLLGRRPAKLSGGERQRVAIGRALLACPRLLLFDEPFAALDRQRKLEVLPLIERLRDEFKIPIIYVSHAMEEVVRLATHVVVLDAGKVSAAGTPEAVFAGASVLGEDRRFGRSTVLSTVVGDHDAAYGLTALHHPAGTLWLAGMAGPQGATARVLVHATDVTLAVGAPGQLSTRSTLSGTITALDPDGALAAVEIALNGGGWLVALATRRALDDLALSVGSAVSALVKTVALDEGSVGR
ncbi:molybdenum ABC transporter ATP-binding protein [Beijerinckia sp. L45]|uniref:molybdenum ABC transporter ATP-binding protein n=1 Tax=Beijerinckia sp. L45 TaxID=1641855 RepID=UPI00131BAE31|nr:molybdenum ABC transporter ATP-binding protein [Beijerinckia sp. L45]